MSIPEPTSSIKALMDQLHAALDPVNDQNDTPRQLTESELQFVRKLRIRTGYVTVIQGNDEIAVPCVIDERGHGVFLIQGLPPGWWYLYTKDVAPEWDGDVDSPPVQSEAPSGYVARPLPDSAVPSGNVHVLDGVHKPLDADEFFSGRGRHRWYATRHNPEETPEPKVSTKLPSR